ncbi:hypothetical protein MtrunA17_Chr7g0266611 [Medicago truncatula]|nr:hypothetical protein MtrunA17_Chr7g0266611 [Medicago truncatula]
MHNHKKPVVNRNFVNETTQNKSSKTKLLVIRDTGSPSNVRNLGSPNVAMLQFDHSENSNAQVLAGKSKVPCLETKVTESHLPVVGEFKSSANVGNLGLPSGMMLQFDEMDNDNDHVLAGESRISYSKSELIGSFDDDDIMIPNMVAMSEDLLLDFNLLNGGILFP